MNARVLILYNQPVWPVDHPESASERDVLDVVDKIDSILRDRGYSVSRFGVGHDLVQFLALLREDRPNVVFNLFEGFADRPATETCVASMLEWLGIPFTGCGSDTLTWARDKLRTKHLLRGAGITTAAFFVVEQLPCPACEMVWPVIVKPSNQDASVGIEQSSVVTNQSDLERQVERVLKMYGTPVLVEKYIAGRELFVPVFEAPMSNDGVRSIRTLPPSEIIFRDPSFWPIYTHSAKWTEHSPEWSVTPEQLAEQVPERVAARLQEIAVRTYRLLNGRDYARVDFRVSADAEPYVLELNPNPYILSIGLMEGLKAIGVPHADFVCNLVHAALERGSAVETIGKD